MTFQLHNCSMVKLYKALLDGLLLTRHDNCVDFTINKEKYKGQIVLLYRMKTADTYLQYEAFFILKDEKFQVGI